MLILFLIRLDNRVKIGLVSNLRPSSARDFRLKIEEVRREETVEAEVSYLVNYYNTFIAFPLSVTLRTYYHVQGNSGIIT